MSSQPNTNQDMIYSYGIHPGFHSKVIEDLLRRQAIYYNTLVELENLRRLWFLEIEKIHSAEVQAASIEVERIEAALVDAYKSLRQERASTRSRSVDSDIEEQIAELKATRKAAWNALSLAKSRFRSETYASPNDERLRRFAQMAYDANPADLVDLSGKKLSSAVKVIAKKHKVGPRVIEKINARLLELMLSEEWNDPWKHQQLVSGIVLEATKEARAVSDLPFGTYLLVEEAIAAARNSKPYGDLDRKFIQRQGDPPIDRSGRVGLIIQSGMPLYRALADDGAEPDSKLFIQVEQLTKEFASRSRNWRTKNQRAIVRMKVDSEESRAPITEDIPIIYHRPLPPGCIIKRAWVLGFRSGNRMRYKLQFNISVLPRIVVAPKDLVCAINLGWRKLPSGDTRIAYLVGSDGVSREFCLDQKTLDKIGFSPSIRSISDKLFDEAKAVAASSLAEPPTELSWTSGVLATVSRWRSHMKLHRLAHGVISEYFEHGEIYGVWNRWKIERFSQGKDLFASFEEIKGFCAGIGYNDNAHQLAIYLSFWVQKDRHLFDWETRQREKSLTRRDYTFRVWAKWIDEHYAKIIFEKEGLAKFSTKSATRADPGAGFRNNKSMAASGRFRDIVKGKSGSVRVNEVDSNFNTQRCNLCNHVNAWDTKEDHIHTCGGCGHEHDQDRNNALNQLRIALEGLGDEKTTAASRSGINNPKSSTKRVA
jgi:hypothetical protein